MSEKMRDTLKAIIDAYEEATGERLPDADGEDYRIAQIILDAALTHENGGQEREAQAAAEIEVMEDFENGADINTIHCLDYKLIEHLPHGAKLYLAPPSAHAIEAALAYLDSF